MLKKRTAGLLLHISSLPSDFGIGDFGPQARQFADFLETSGMHIWQILPLNMTIARQGYSPYNCFSAFAGNPLLISPEQLVAERLLQKKEIADAPVFPVDRVDYVKCARYKYRLYRMAFQRFQKQTERSEYRRFVRDNESWLADFSLFMALKDRHGGKLWSAWPAAVKNRTSKAHDEARGSLRESIEFHQFLQYIFSQQYYALKRYCNQKGIQIFGDLPIYVTYDSADVWAAPGWFKLTRTLKPKYIAGVPPDYFSKTGQLWGNPVYDWSRLAQDGYGWWIRRMHHNFELYDLVRIDHFRGFEAFWQVPAGQKTAMKGHWVKGPGEDFFRTLMDYYPQPPIVVEDLGEITPAVRELIGRFSFPVMKVLQFAFDGNFVTNTHLPHNHPENALVYTGTHDNNTTRGWFQKELSPDGKKILSDYMGKKVLSRTVHHDMMRLAMASVAKIAMIPVQDVLGLDQKARMNNPAKTQNNWQWRMAPGLLKHSLANHLREMAACYGRL